MMTCLTTALQKAGHKAVNFDKLREITQRPDGNAAQILASLAEGIVRLLKATLYSPTRPVPGHLSQREPDTGKTSNIFQLG